MYKKVSSDMNFVDREKETVKFWKENEIFEKSIEERKDDPTYTFYDGPPTANGKPHIGHVLTRVIKDMIPRYQTMKGHKIIRKAGWDTHGLPVELEVEKMLGLDGKEQIEEYGMEPFIKKCKESVWKYKGMWEDFSDTVGFWADMENPYITYDNNFIESVWWALKQIWDKKLLYKGFKIVPYCPRCGTPLSAQEVAQGYKDVKERSAIVRFKAVGEEAYFLAWTTTPWTLPSNIGLCVNPEETYAKVEAADGYVYYMAEALLDTVLGKLADEEAGTPAYKVLETFKGKELEMITCKHPLYDRESLVILGDHVTAEAGTGCVHTAPGFGADDFFVGQKYGLPAYCNVDEHGCMMKDCGEWLEGQYVDDANKTVTMKLDELGVLLKLEFITHSYPHDWRTKKPIIFRATDQWFCSVDKIREKLLSEIDKVNWLNEWGHIRIYNMIKDRGDWCISRQRSWGVPIPIIYCEDGTPIMEEEVFKHISNLFRKYGSNVWFERDEKDLLPEGYINEHSPNGIFKKEKDIMDVWFDSGSSHTGCMIERGYRYPVDLYFEGSDQYRGWFNSSLIVGTAAHGCAPYKTVLSHGFVLDGKGNKMSKSLGNTVDPIKLVNQYGADIVRLWATSVAYQQDVRISNDIMKQISENYRKIRNTMRFVLGNLNDFKQADLVAVEALADVDKYMLAQLNDLIKGYHKAYDNYDFAEANQLILNYFTNLLSSFYMDFTKDILYIEKADSLRRRQVQTVLYYHAKAMMKLISPVLVFTAEELHDHFHCDDNKADSIFLEPNVEMINMPNSDQLKAHFDRFLELRKDVMKALEGLRNEKIIKSNMEAKVTISLKDEFKEMASMLADLKQLFIVAKVELVKDSSLEEFDSAYIKVEKFEGHQCPRCWNYFDEDEMEGELCPRCHAVING